MTAALALIALAILSTLVATRKPRRHKPDGRDCAPLTRHEREERWRAAFIPQADDYLATASRGAVSKRRMLQQVRNRQARSKLAEIAERVPAERRAPSVRIVEHYGIGARTKRHIDTPPLRSLQSAAPVQITVKRPRAVLSMAR